MSLLSWNDELATGHAGIDTTHRDFIAHANRLFVATDADLPQRLREFEAHARAHFAEEDALMKSTAYPSAGCHVDEHAAVLASVAEVIELVVKQQRFDIGRDLTDHLMEWFPRHTDHMDKSLAQWLVKQATGGAPVTLRRAASP
jgi:hemerythrin